MSTYVNSNFIDKSTITLDAKKQFPEMDITDNVHLMGDWQNQDYTKMKAYTKVEVKADYIQIQISAYSLVEAWGVNLVDSGATVTSNEID